MKTKSITYTMKRTTGQYENDTAEVTIELEAGDTVQSAIAQAKTQCLRALRSDGSPRQDKFYQVQTTKKGRDAFDKFVNTFERAWYKD